MTDGKVIEAKGLFGPKVEPTMKMVGTLPPGKCPMTRIISAGLKQGRREFLVDSIEDGLDVTEYFSGNGFAIICRSESGKCRVVFEKVEFK